MCTSWRTICATATARGSPASARSRGKALRHNYYTALWNKTALIDGKVAAVWGLGGSALGYTGMPWLLTAPLVESYALSCVRLYRQEVGLMLQSFPRLENYVLASYEKSVRLLALSGFRLDEPKPAGPHNVPYRRFWMEA